MNKFKYFADCQCLEDVKETYRKLCFKYHPDISKETNCTQIMQEINTEYTKAFNTYKDIHRNAQKETYTARETSTETPEEFSNIINAIIHFVGIKIEIIGKWIWITGNTMPYREDLKKLKFTWCSNKKAWTYHRPEDRKLTKQTYSFDTIRSMFGSQEIKTESQMQLA
jgi:curved DNA-binding protein CbpA